MTDRRPHARRGRGALGRPRLHHAVIDSTNERAKLLGAAGAPHGTLVTAGRQTAGRGRQGRRWEAQGGRALLASVVVRPLDEHDALLPLAAAVGVCEGCERAAPAVSCAIKWPNDVWVATRKLAGILIEGRPQEGWAVIGIGVNVGTARDELPPDLRDSATSLAIEQGGKAPSPEDVLQAVLATLGDRLEDPADALLSAWRTRDALAGHAVSWGDGHGTAVGVDARGALLVDTPDGRRALDAGEVHLSPLPAPPRGSG